ncbi:hypothetical protein PUR_16350 [Paenibacillus sp. URB8-2]|nr:hypothetical protein PUR_16350 [Paenibacillus sp. URB8-2]
MERTERMEQTESHGAHRAYGNGQSRMERTERMEQTEPHGAHRAYGMDRAAWSAQSIWNGQSRMERTLPTQRTKKPVQGNIPGRLLPFL